MKRIILSTLVLLFFLSLFSSCGSKPETPIGTETTGISTASPTDTPTEEMTEAPKGFDIDDPERFSRIACVGDSITYGYGASSPSSGSYPARLQAMLGNRYVIGGFGWGGSTYCGLSKIYTEGEEFRASIAFEPDVVIILLGTNDTNSWDRTGSGVEEYAQDLVHFYRSLPSHPEVFLCTPIHRYNNENNNRIIREELVPILARVAAAEDCWFVDLYEKTDNWEAYLMDGLHPNDEGYRKLAALILEAMRNPVKATAE